MAAESDTIALVVGPAPSAAAAIPKSLFAGFGPDLFVLKDKAQKLTFSVMTDKECVAS